MFPFITDADAAQAVSVVLALVILKKNMVGIILNVIYYMMLSKKQKKAA